MSEHRLKNKKTVENVHVVELDSIEECEDGNSCPDDTQLDDNDAFERYLLWQGTLT